VEELRARRAGGEALSAEQAAKADVHAAAERELASILEALALAAT
jgi:hypothetical protein